MTAALGPEWNRAETPPRWIRSFEESYITVVDFGEESPLRRCLVSLADSDEGGISRHFVNPTQAVAFAHLLVAAERIAAGARVALSGLDLWRPGVAGGRPAVYQGDRFMSTHEARRRALDLLRAADAADLTANSR